MEKIRPSIAIGPWPWPPCVCYPSSGAELMLIDKIHRDQSRIFQFSYRRVARFDICTCESTSSTVWARFMIAVICTIKLVHYFFQQVPAPKFELDILKQFEIINCPTLLISTFLCLEPLCDHENIKNERLWNVRGIDTSNYITWAPNSRLICLSDCLSAVSGLGAYQPSAL